MRRLWPLCLASAGDAGEGWSRRGAVRREHKLQRPQMSTVILACCKPLRCRMDVNQRTGAENPGAGSAKLHAWPCCSRVQQDVQAAHARPRPSGSAVRHGRSADAQCSILWQRLWNHLTPLVMSPSSRAASGMRLRLHDFQWSHSGGQTTLPRRPAGALSVVAEGRRCPCRCRAKVVHTRRRGARETPMDRRCPRTAVSVAL